MKSILSFAGVLLLLQSPLAAGDTLPIKPGLWESTVTSTNSFAGTSTQTNQECVTINQFDPKTMAREAEGCDVVESNVNGSTLTFSMNCDIEGGTTVISGQYQSDGDTGSGAMNMEMSFGDQTMTMESTMTTVRIGDC